MKTDNQKSIALLFVLLFTFPQNVTAVDEVATLKHLEGTWVGDGKFMGNDARLELKYEWVLNGKFLRLSLKERQPHGGRRATGV